jgi:hypothetical protein
MSVVIDTVRMRTVKKVQVCDLCPKRIAKGKRALKIGRRWRHFECHLKAAEGE